MIVTGKNFFTGTSYPSTAIDIKVLKCVRDAGFSKSGSRKRIASQVWWHTLVIGKQRQEKQELKASLGSAWGWRPPEAVLQRKIGVSKSTA